MPLLASKPTKSAATADIPTRRRRCRRDCATHRPVVRSLAPHRRRVAGVNLSPDSMWGVRGGSPGGAHNTNMNLPYALQCSASIILTKFAPYIISRLHFMCSRSRSQSPPRYPGTGPNGRAHYYQHKLVCRSQNLNAQLEYRSVNQINGRVGGRQKRVPHQHTHIGQPVAVSMA